MEYCTLATVCNLTKQGNLYINSKLFNTLQLKTVKKHELFIKYNCLAAKEICDELCTFFSPIGNYGLSLVSEKQKTGITI